MSTVGAPSGAPEFTTLPDEVLPRLSADELAAYQRALKVQLALRSPLDYAEYVSPTTRRFRHVEFTNDYLVALYEGRLYADGPGPTPVWCHEHERFEHPDVSRHYRVVYRLAIAEPPRHGKSYLVSEHTPPWILSRHPDWRVAVTSYEADFAADWGKKVRNHVKEHGADFGISLEAGSQASANWDLAGRRGGMNTAGVGGPITGRGFQWVDIDDPIKNAEEAMSEVIRAKHWDWLLSTVITRLEPIYTVDQDGVERETPGRILLMNTRWHEDDLQGKATSAEPTMWCVLNLPALADPEITPKGDPLGRAPGEALCPERYPRQALEAIRDTQGAYWFGAMYQGSPVVMGGGIIAKPFRYHRHHRADATDPGIFELTDAEGAVTRVKARDCFFFGIVDLAASTKTSADWSVMTVWAVTPEHKLLLTNRWRTRMESPDHSRKIREWYDSCIPRPRFLGVEDRTYGTSLIQQFIREGGIIVRPLDADTDKVTRAIPAGLAIQAGQVYFPADAEWKEEWEHELLGFDTATYDDQVDNLAYAVYVWERLPKPRPKKAYEEQTMEAKVKRHDETILRTKGRRRKVHPTVGRW